MSSAHRVISALAVGLLVACGEPPNRGSASDEPSAPAHVENVPSGQTQSPEERSGYADAVDDCTRGRIENSGALKHLTGYRFERAPERTEIESAILPNGVPITIIYSGCHHYSAHYRFRLDSEPATQIGTNALEVAARLMRSLADASASRGIGSLASEIAEAAAEGKYGLDDDVTGGYWEEYKAVGVSLESEPGSRVMVVKHHIVM